MNTYQLSFFLKLPSGEVRGAGQLIIACSATDAIRILHSLPLPGVLVGAVTWTLTGPRLPRLPVPLGNRAAA